MAKTFKFLCVLIIFLLLDEVKGGGWLTMNRKGQETVERLEGLINKLSGDPDGDTKNFDKVIDLIATINSDLDSLQSKFDKAKENVMDAMFSLQNSFSIEVDMNEYRMISNDLMLRYDEMKLMSKNLSSLGDITKRKFAEWNVSPNSNSLDSLLMKMFSMYFGYHQLKRYAKIPLVDKIAMEFKYHESHNLCPPISAQQKFYSDLIEMKFLEVKGYLVNKFSWTLLRELDGKNFTGDENYFRLEHDKRVKFMTEKLREVIEASGRELRTCDPENWEFKVNYEKLTRLVQGYLVNEENLNEDFSCTENCAKYEKSKVYGCHHSDSYCKKDIGSGKVMNCYAESNKGSITVCPSTDPARRYEHFVFEHEKGKHHYGKQEKCHRDIISAESWLRFVYRCSYCFCLIDEMGTNSDRFFDVRGAISDVHKNKVVTGIRFIKKNRVMYLQIQQGELAPLGSIDKSTLEWKGVEEYELNKENNDVDYVTLDSDKKTIGLDVIHTKDPYSVVTGVMLYPYGTHLKLLVRFSKFDFDSGELIDPDNRTNNTYWQEKKNSGKNKLPLEGLKPGEGAKVSTRTKEPSVPSSASYDFVEFTHSDKKDDASQTTLPFFDIQDVVSLSPVPLSGIGLYHKGNKGYGGFIAPKIFTLDFSTYL